MSERLYFLGTPEDSIYAAKLKSMASDAQIFVSFEPVVTLMQITAKLKANNITGCFTTSHAVLQKLLAARGVTEKASIDNYAGSYFLHDGIEFVILNPLKQLTTVSYMPFLMRRHMSKLTNPKNWEQETKFNWEMLTPQNAGAIFTLYQDAYVIAVDIETKQDPLSITCIGYTALFISPTGERETHSCVLWLDDMYCVELMRKFNWQLKAPKIMQGGRYDISYLCMYNAPCYNWLWDTLVLFYCWYSEMPKDLGFLNAFCTRRAMYWKDMAKTNDKIEYSKYNALDTHATVSVFVNLMMEMPEWARKNYLMKFPLEYPAHLCSMTGIKRDMEVLAVANKEVSTEIEALTTGLEQMTATPGFNSNSYKQVRQLAKILGLGDVAESDDAALEKFSLVHPLNGKLFKTILTLRKKRKLLSTYLPMGNDAKEFHGRILYSLQPTGTDSGRTASKESSFWCGLQIQNITRGKSVKQTFVADDGFLWGEADYKQAESRDTAYIAGEEKLITAVSGTRDFHAVNASSFFGTAYELIFDDATCETLDKELRDLAKRTNHGASYNMMARTMLRTMGETKVWAAKRMLKLSTHYQLLDVTEHLLKVFHATYPGLRSVYYPWVIEQVETTRMLVGATGWTRWCFGNPAKNKLDLNSYIAHNPQSLNSMKLDIAFDRIFKQIAMHKEHRNSFKLIAPIHDSILFQYRIGHEYLAEKVCELMQVEVTVKGADGKIRIYIVPSDNKIGGKYWSDLK